MYTPAQTQIHQQTMDASLDQPQIAEYYMCRKSSDSWEAMYKDKNKKKYWGRDMYDHTLLTELKIQSRKVINKRNRE